MTSFTTPWTAEQVTHLNDYQQSGRIHPFTCGQRDQHPNNEGVLVATENGWHCPADGCDYTQDWAHAFMAASPPPPDPRDFMAKVRAENQRGHEALQQLLFATEFRIPCPEAADPDRSDSGPVLQPEPLIVQKVTANWADRFPDGWLILNPNLQPGDHVWTGDGWVYRGNLHIGVIYRWTRDEAIAEAQRLATEETRRYETWVAEQRAAARREQP
ncbi:hypothetical protein [Kitasatospora mediocidica]|uniref:hypothetical protein n=1 Tax=Kitasatospora mediocidica TaxID=58352 RepID=UPI0005694CD3|nr:hypothetical protein [Kitasatospora mediocidica]